MNESISREEGLMRGWMRKKVQERKGGKKLNERRMRNVKKKRARDRERREQKKEEMDRRGKRKKESRENKRNYLRSLLSTASI